MTGSNPVNRSEKMARQAALAIPALLLGGAYISQYVFGLYPCEMCWWQRWPHFAALALALLSLAAPRPRFWLGLSGIAIIVSGLLGGFHAGVEYGWWEGLTSCATAVGGGAGDDPLEAIMNAPLIRCDVAPWTLFGVSLAGWNFLISTASGCAILGLLAKGRA